jgi:hypothetical protein
VQLSSPDPNGWKRGPGPVAHKSVMPTGERDVIFWHLADSSSELALRLLSGGKADIPAMVQLMPLYEYTA